MRFFVIILLSIIIFSCTEQAPVATIAVPQKKTSVDTFPFVSEDKVDTSKMMIIDERCVVEAYYTWDAAKERAKRDHKQFNYQCTDRFYTIQDFVSWSGTNIYFLQKAKIPSFKIDSVFKFICFIDSSKSKYFISVDCLKTRTGSIYFDAKQKPKYIDEIQVAEPFCYAKWYFTK